MAFSHGGNSSTGCTTAFQWWLTSCGEQHVSQQLFKKKKKKRWKKHFHCETRSLAAHCLITQPPHLQRSLCLYRPPSQQQQQLRQGPGIKCKKTIMWNEGLSKRSLMKSCPTEMFWADGVIPHNYPLLLCTAPPPLLQLQPSSAGLMKWHPTQAWQWHNKNQQTDKQTNKRKKERACSRAQ